MVEYSPQDGALHGRLCVGRQRENGGSPFSPPISLAAAAPSRKAAGTLQWLVFRHGLNSWKDFAFLLAEDGRQPAGVTWTLCLLTSAGHWWRAGVTTQSRATLLLSAQCRSCRQALTEFALRQSRTAKCSLSEKTQMPRANPSEKKQKKTQKESLHLCCLISMAEAKSQEAREPRGKRALLG